MYRLRVPENPGVALDIDRQRDVDLTTTPYGMQSITPCQSPTYLEGETNFPMTDEITESIVSQVFETQGRRPSPAASCVSWMSPDPRAAPRRPPHREA
jgi:hypothetical protein